MIICGYLWVTQYLYVENPAETEQKYIECFARVVVQIIALCALFGTFPEFWSFLEKFWSFLGKFCSFFGKVLFLFWKSFVPFLEKFCSEFPKKFCSVNSCTPLAGFLYLRLIMSIRQFEKVTLKVIRYIAGWRFATKMRKKGNNSENKGVTNSSFFRAFLY